MQMADTLYNSGPASSLFMPGLCQLRRATRLRTLDLTECGVNAHNIAGLAALKLHTLVWFYAREGYLRFSPLRHHCSVLPRCELLIRDSWDFFYDLVIGW